MYGCTGGAPKSPARVAAPDWNGIQFRAKDALARAPRNADALLLPGWAKCNLGRPQEAGKQRRLAGWVLLAGGELPTTLSGVEMFEHRHHPYWKAATDQIAHLMRGREKVHVAVEHVVAGALDGGILNYGSRDTRAEFWFQSGRVEEAAREAERNAREEPGNQYLQRRFERMKRGDPSIPLPGATSRGG